MGWTYGLEISRGGEGRGGGEGAAGIWCESKTHNIGIDSAGAGASATIV